MNAVLELEVNSFRKLVKDFACLSSDGKLFHRTAPPLLQVAEAISIVLLVRGKGTASLFSEISLSL